jgi:hypothetical protein
VRFWQKVQALPRGRHVALSESAAAALFYVSLAAALGGAMLAARGAVERRSIDRRGLLLLAVGGVGLAAALIAYALGPRRMLPF